MAGKPKIEHITLPVADLTLNDGNPRKIKKEAMAKLVASVSDFSEMLDIRPIVCTAKGVVLGGNMRLRACIEAGMEKVPVIRVSGLTKAQEKEFIIKDNVSGGDWDWEMLTADWDIPLLENWGLDLPSGIGQEDAEDDDFDADAAGVKTDIVPGDLIEIGEHRLLCGDSTNPSDVERLLNGEKPTLMVTDPPYGVDVEGKTKRKLKIMNDAGTMDDTHALFRDTLSAFLPLLADAAAIYATVPAGQSQLGFMQVMMEMEVLRQCMVWNKGRIVIGHSDYNYAHEPILYGWKPGAKHYFIKDRSKSTVFDIPKPERNADHPTMKPIPLFAEFISNSSRGGQAITDPFLGSGTTMVAAQQLGRKCYGMEIDPVYCQVIINRMRNSFPDLSVKVNGKHSKPC